MNEITLSSFASSVAIAAQTYPDAKVSSVGSGVRNNEWYFCVWIKTDKGKEVCIDIPCYRK